MQRSVVPSEVSKVNFMGNKESIQSLVSGFVKDVEGKHSINSKWKVSESQLVLHMIVSYSFKDVRDLQFNEVLNVGKELILEQEYKFNEMYKCSLNVHCEPPLLAMQGVKWLGVVQVDRENKHGSRRIFELKLNAGWSRQAHHWLVLNQQPYLCVQTEHNEIKMYRLVAGCSFVPDESYTVRVNGDINYCEVDSKYQHMVLVVNRSVVQVRSLNDVQNIKKLIPLEPDNTAGNTSYLDNDYKRNVRISADGTHCVVAGGNSKRWFYIVRIDDDNSDSETPKKYVSQFLDSTFAPCFINGETRYVSVGDRKGRLEIWDIVNNTAVKTLQVTQFETFILSAASTQNVLAIGARDKRLRLYDVRNWECVCEQLLKCEGDSLHVTDDLKYVTFAGCSGDKCIILEIK